MLGRLEANARVGRRAALLLAALLALVTAFHLYWALGGTWGLREALGGDMDDPSGALQLAAGAVALFLLAAVLVVLGRVGLWGARVPFSLFRWGTWALAVALLLAAINNLAAETAWERFAFAPLALLLALLAAVVALSPSRSRDDGRGSRVHSSPWARSRGKSGPRSWMPSARRGAERR